MPNMETMEKLQTWSSLEQSAINTSYELQLFGLDLFYFHYSLYGISETLGHIKNNTNDTTATEHVTALKVTVDNVLLWILTTDIYNFALTGENVEMINIRFAYDLIKKFNKSEQLFINMNSTMSNFYNGIGGIKNLLPESLFSELLMSYTVSSHLFGKAYQKLVSVKKMIENNRMLNVHHQSLTSKDSFHK